MSRVVVEPEKEVWRRLWPAASRRVTDSLAGLGRCIVDVDLHPLRGCDNLQKKYRIRQPGCRRRNRMLLPFPCIFSHRLQRLEGMTSVLFKGKNKYIEVTACCVLSPLSGRNSVYCSRLICVLFFRIGFITPESMNYYRLEPRNKNFYYFKKKA